MAKKSSVNQALGPRQSDLRGKKSAVFTNLLATRKSVQQCQYHYAINNTYVRACPTVHPPQRCNFEHPQLLYIPSARAASCGQRCGRHFFSSLFSVEAPKGLNKPVLLTGWVVFKISRVGSGRVGPGRVGSGGLQNLMRRVGSG